jgi:ABC-2 type transport system ATP-binding protein
MDNDEDRNLERPRRNYETRTYLEWLDHYLAGTMPKPPLDVTYFRNWVKYEGDATKAYARAKRYPFGSKRTLFLSGSNALVGDRTKIAAGSSIFTPPSGGAPTSYTETSALDQDQPVRDAAGTFAQFVGPPLRSNLDVIGVPSVDVKVTAPSYEALAPGGGAPSLLVLFFKLYELTPDGEIKLAHRLISPVRIADFSHPVHVQLPGIVHRFRKGNRLALTIAGGDAAYRGNNHSGLVTISTSPGSPGVLKLPVVPPGKQLRVTARDGLGPIDRRTSR